MQRRCDMDNASSCTLNSEYQIFKDRPLMIRSEQVSHSSFQPSVHHLEQYGQILHVVAAEGLKAAFVFCDADEPYRER